MIPSSIGMATDHLASVTIGKYPKAWGIVVISLVVILILLIILVVVYWNRYKECEMNHHHKATMLGHPLGNLNTGSNNPMWHHQAGDAGWGGPLHTSYQHGESRVWGASAEDQGRHDHHVLVPQYSSGCGDDPMMHSKGVHDPMRGIGHAAAEAHALMAAQAYEPATMKHLNDDALMHVMNGTH